MKKIILLFGFFGSVAVNAQNIKVENGKKITGFTVSSMDMDMGMAGQIKINSEVTNVINVTGADSKNYTATNTITKMKMKQEMMGKEEEFDSEKKGNSDSEIDKDLNAQINKASVITIDKNSGKATEPNKSAEPDEDSNPMNELIGSIAANSAAKTASDAFFIIPSGKKNGDKWSDSASAEGMKTMNTYEMQNGTDGLTAITINATAKGTITKETQGMQMEVTMDNKTTTLLSVDAKTSLVKKRSTEINMNGTFEVMGQSLPIIGKGNTISTFE
jgi:hypothetical protein